MKAYFLSRTFNTKEITCVSKFVRCFWKVSSKTDRATPETSTFKEPIKEVNNVSTKSQSFLNY